MPETANPNIAFARCAGYEPAVVSAALDRLLAPLGGMGAFARPGCRVLVKPNLLTDRAPEAAVTTHPEVVRQVIRRLKAAGAAVTVADSPAFAARLDQVWRVTGVGAVCSEEGVPLASIEAGPLTPLTRDGYAFAVSSLALRADLIVNLPKVKSHSLTTLTAAVKNFYGVIPGHLKTDLHKRYSRPAAFGGLVRAVCRAMPATLNIADGVLAMEGDGPSSGTPVALDFLAASTDPFALDLALCDVLRINPERVPYLAGMSRSPDYTTLVWHGDRPEVPCFRLPRHTAQIVLTMLPSALVRRVGAFVWFRPSFGPACVRCGKCVTACPVGALALPARGLPALNGAACIGCCCCHEVCPARAIAIRPSPLVRLARGIARACSFRKRQEPEPVVRTDRPIAPP